MTLASCSGFYSSRSSCSGGGASVRRCGMSNVESEPTSSGIGDSPQTEPPADRSAGSLRQGLVESPFAPAALAVLALVAAVVGSRVLSPYMVFLGISVVTAAIALVGTGVVSGRAGMISLCPLSFAAVGAAVVAQLNEWPAPGGVLVWRLPEDGRTVGRGQ